MTALKDLAATAVGRGRGRRKIIEALDAALAAEELPPAAMGDLDTGLSEDHGALVAWLSHLVARGDREALHLLYTGEESPFHDALYVEDDTAPAGTDELKPSPALTAALRGASGLPVFDPTAPQRVLDPARVQAALALDLVDPQPDEGRPAAALAWYRNAGATPDLPTGPWTPAGLAHGDERLRRALERLVAAAGGEAHTGPVLAAALALCRLALGRLPGTARNPVAVRVLFDAGGVGGAGRLSLTLLPGGPGPGAGSRDDAAVHRRRPVHRGHGTGLERGREGALGNRAVVPPGDRTRQGQRRRQAPVAPPDRGTVPRRGLRRAAHRDRPRPPAEPAQGTRRPVGRHARTALGPQQQGQAAQFRHGGRHGRRRAGLRHRVPRQAGRRPRLRGGGRRRVGRARSPRSGR